MINLALTTLLAVAGVLSLFRFYRRWRELRILDRGCASYPRWIFMRSSNWLLHHIQKLEEPAGRLTWKDSNSNVGRDQGAASLFVRQYAVVFCVLSVVITVLVVHSEALAALFIVLCLVAYVGLKLYRRAAVLRNNALVSRIVPDFIRSIRTADGLTSTGLIAHAVKGWTKRPNSHALYGPLQAGAWLASTGYSWSHALSTVCEELSESVAVPVVVGFERGLDSTNHEARKFLDEAELVAASQSERLLDIWVGDIVQVIHGASAVCMAALVAWLLA